MNSLMFFFRSLMISESSPLNGIKNILYYYIILGFASMLFCWIGWSCWIIAAERQVRCIRFTLFRNILRQEIGWFDIHNTGELSNRLIDDLGKKKRYFNI